MEKVIKHSLLAAIEQLRSISKTVQDSRLIDPKSYQNRKHAPVIPSDTLDNEATRVNAEQDCNRRDNEEDGGDTITGRLKGFKHVVRIIRREVAGSLEEKRQ